MRRLILSAATAILLAGTAGQALAQQRPGTSYDASPVMPAPPPAPMPVRTEIGTAPVAPPPPAAAGPRWGDRVNGRWWAGARAPGGWHAYKRPKRGRKVAPYWLSSGWVVNDWAGYGLPRPPFGHRWSRYYDDAVLIDDRGRVLDWAGGVDWDRYDRLSAPLPPPVVTVSPGGAAVVTTTTTSAAPGRYADGYYYPGATVTTITIEKPAPVVETASPAPVARRHWHKRRVKTKTKLLRR